MKEIREKFLQQVHENGGDLTHDLSNELHYQYLLELLGGEEFLKKNHPHVYKVLCNTKAFHEKRKAIDKAGLGVGETTVGFTNSEEIRYVNFDPLKNFRTASSIHRTGISPSLAIICAVKDLSNNKKLDGFAIFKENSSSLEGIVEQVSSGLLSTTKDLNFQVDSNFMCLTYDEFNNEIYESSTKSRKVSKTSAKANFVEDVIVEAPDSKKGQYDRPNVVVVYDRQAQVGENYDYYYPLVSQGNLIKIQIPFKGRVVFNKMVKAVSVDQASFKMQLEHPKFGVIAYNNDKEFNGNNGIFKFKDNIVEWEFPTDWKTLMNKKSFVSGTNFNFYCEISVNVKIGNTPAQFPVPIVITSDELVHTDPSYEKIKRIDIYWGCLGKDTQIKMADGSLKSVADIEVGESVLGAYGEVAKVMDIMTGNEKEIIQVEVKSGDSISLTGEHPILTERGMVMAKNLLVGDVLILDKKKAFLTAAYLKEYNDKVYSLVLDKPNTSIIGNDFIVGDFEAQQKAIAELAKIENTTMDKSDFQKDMEALYKELDYLMKTKHE